MNRPLTRNRFRTMAACETLEPRQLFAAGNVSVGLVNGVWQFTGDRNPNAIALTLVGGNKVRVEGLSSDGGKTTINGKQAPLDITVGGSISLSMREGNDTVSVRGLDAARPLRVPGSMAVDLGNGIDVLTADHVYVVGATKVEMGVESGNAGYERAILYAVDSGPLTYRTQRSVGSNSLSMLACTVRGNVGLTGSSASNAVMIASSRILGSVTGHLGHEPNTSTLQDGLNVEFSTVSGAVDVDFGDGRGVGFIISSKVDSLRLRYGGYKSDQTVFNDSTIRSVTIEGGPGAGDRVSGSRNKFQSLRLVSIEQNDLR